LTFDNFQLQLKIQVKINQNFFENDEKNEMYLRLYFMKAPLKERGTAWTKMQKFDQWNWLTSKFLSCIGEETSKLLSKPK
jgi:hypothetical protein